MLLDIISEVLDLRPAEWKKTGRDKDPLSLSQHLPLDLTNGSQHTVPLGFLSFLKKGLCFLSPGSRVITDETNSSHDGSMRLCLTDELQARGSGQVSSGRCLLDKSFGIKIITQWTAVRSSNTALSLPSETLSCLTKLDFISIST